MKLSKTDLIGVSFTLAIAVLATVALSVILIEAGRPGLIGVAAFLMLLVASLIIFAAIGIETKEKKDNKDNKEHKGRQ